MVELQRGSRVKRDVQRIRRIPFLQHTWRTNITNITPSSGLRTIFRSGPNTQVFEGMTLTSPTAYMSFSGVGVDWCGTQSIVKTNTIIPVDPHDVSSLRVVPYPIAGEPYPYGTFAGPYSFNYGDFNTPMPYSAYTNAWFCHGEPANFCPIMTPDQYSPIVAYPKSFMEILNPMYSACTLIYDYRGVYDPPHALQQEPSAAQPIPVSPTTPPARGPSPIPTGPNMNPTTPASASPPIIAPTPSRTPNQQPTPNPTEPSAAGPPPSYPQPPGQGGSGDPAGNDPRPAQDPNPPPAQPAQDPPPGNPPSDPDSDPRPAPGPAGNDNGNVNGDPGTPSSGNTPRPEGGSSEGDPARGGDPAQAVGGNIVSMLLSPGGRGGGGGGGSSGANAGADSDPSNGGAPENSGYGYGSSSGSDSPSDPGIDILPALAEGGSNPRPSPGDFAPGQGASSGGGGGSAGGDAGAQDPRVVAQVGGQPVYAIPNEPNAVQIAGATLRPGSQTEMGGTPVSVGNGYLVVASGAQASTVALGGSGVAQDLRVVGKVGGLLVYAVPNDPDGVQIDGTTLRAGTMTEIGGAPVSVGNGYVVVGSGAAASTISLPGTTAGANARLGLGGDNGAGNAIVQAAAGTGAVLTLGSQTLTALDEPGHSGIVVIGSQTLSLGGPLATIDGHVMSVGSNGLVIDGSSTVALATPLTADSGSGTKATAVVSLGSDVVTASEESNGDMVIGTQTLSVGGPALTIDGHVFSDGPNGVVIDGSRTASWAPFSGIAEEEVRVTGADGKVLTAVEESGHPGTVVMDGSITLSVGGPAITVDGEVVSLAPGGLVVNGSVTKAFSNAPITASATNTAANSATGAATRFGNAQATSTNIALNRSRDRTADRVSDGGAHTYRIQQRMTAQASQPHLTFSAEMKKAARLEDESGNILVISDEDRKSLGTRDTRVVAALSGLDSRGNLGGATGFLGWADTLGVGSGRIQSTLIQGLDMRSPQGWCDRCENG
ncbi:MAG: hypothetical protein Q9157_003501 [Trypethelium eluteriae]